MIKEILDKLSKLGSNPIWNHLPTTCRFEIIETVHNNKLSIELVYLEKDTDNSVLTYVPIRKNYDLNLVTKEEVEKLFNDEILIWIVFSKTSKNTDGTIFAYSCSDLIRKGLRGYKNG